jgi:protein involved in polysaccharide export with SLBB domain
LRKKNERISDLIDRAGGFTPFAYVKGASLVRNESSVGIDLEAILKNKGSKIDMFLEKGDRLIIPIEKQTVKVSGMVLKPSLVQFSKGDGLKSYVSKSGGFLENAKKSKIYVSYPNGDIKTVSKFLFFKSYPKLLPGSTIFVPAKPKKERMSTAEVMGITTSIATLGILIQTILN